MCKLFTKVQINQGMHTYLYRYDSSKSVDWFGAKQTTVMARSVVLVQGKLRKLSHILDLRHSFFAHENFFGLTFFKFTLDLLLPIIPETRKNASEISFNPPKNLVAQIE